MSLQRGCEGTRNGGVEVEGRQYLLRELLQATVVLDGEGGREIGLDDERAAWLGRPEFCEEPRHCRPRCPPKTSSTGSASVQPTIMEGAKNW
ncbi:hypothetical protein GW17_00024949 [Ensete ventricosum]|nr:hypothetical protein GW17_00024949 [Ensete ventricosum]